MSLKSAAARGAKWTTLSTGASTALQMLQLAVLAQVLRPSDFGVMAIASVAAAFAKSFADMGLSNSLVSRQTTSEPQLSSIYWISLLAGAIVSIVFWAAGGAIALVFGESQVQGLIQWTAIVFLLSAFGQQFQILLQRDLHFDSLAKIEVLSSVVATVMTICSAFLGAGVYALVWGTVGGAVVRSVLLVFRGRRIWVPSFVFKLHGLRYYIRFGLYQMGQRSVNYLSANIDYLMIAYFLGSEELGLYTIAYQLVITPLLKVGPILTRVAFPVFAKRQTNNTVLSNGYIELTNLMALAIFPALAGLAVVAPLFVPVVFGAGWEASIGLVQILAGVGVLKAISSPSGSMMLAKSRPDIGFAWNVLVAVVNTIAFGIFVSLGTVAVAWTYLAVSMLYFALLAGIMQKLIELRFRDYGRTLIRPFLFTAIMAAIVLASAGAMEKLEIVPMYELCAQVMIGIVAYTVLLAMFEKARLLEIRSLMFNQRGLDT